MRPRWRVLRALFPVLLCLMVSIGGHAAPTQKSRQQNLSSRLGSVRQEIRQTRAKVSSMRQQLHRTWGRAQAVRSDLRSADVRLDEAQRALSATRRRLQAAKSEQRATAARLQVLEERLAARYELLGRRIAANYKHGQVRYASVVLGSRSMDDLLSRGLVVRRVLESDRALIEGVRRDRELLAAEKQRRDEQVQRVARLESELARRKLRAAALAEEKKTALQVAKRQAASQQQQLEAARRQLAALEADSARIESMLRALAATPRGRARALQPMAGGFARPVGGRVTSRFGMRVHPILRVSKLHTGIDFSVPSGTPVSAAAAGEVVTAAYLPGYGNCVVIVHGGGVATLYGHLSSLSVRPGQSVRRGQMIARSGSTGYSTGPHLHFEVRRNGRPVAPPF